MIGQVKLEVRLKDRKGDISTVTVLVYGGELLIDIDVAVKIAISKQHELGEYNILQIIFPTS